MIRTVSTLIVITALAGPAAAQDITVSIAGKDARTIAVEIDKAAWAVCSTAYLKDDIDLHDVPDCAKSAADDGKAQAKSLHALAAAATASDVVLARNETEGAPSR